MPFRRARDWDNPRLLRQQPGKRDLARCRVFALRHSLEEIDDCLIRLSILGVETRQRTSKIRAIDLRLFINLAAQEPFSQRAERHEPDAEFLERR